MQESTQCCAHRGSASAHNNNHVRSMWASSEYNSVPPPWQSSPAWIASPFTTVVPNKGLPILSGSQNKKITKGNNITPWCQANDTLHAKWLPWHLQSHCHFSTWLYCSTEGQYTVHKAKKATLSKTVSQRWQTDFVAQCWLAFHALPQKKVTPQWRYMETGQTGSTDLPQSMNN